MSDLPTERIGKITASRIKDVLAEGKGISRAKYAAELAAERMTGRPHRKSFVTDATEHGNEFEAIAATRYEIRNGVMVEGNGKIFIPHPTIKRAGCCPDRLVGDEGLVEIKCPDSHTFIDYTLKGEIPRVYRLQMIFQIACTRRACNDFYAFDPDMPEEYGDLQIRLVPTKEEVEKMEFEVIKFDLEVESLIEKIKESKV
jgi:predicted phage-related endonuclease